MHGSLLSPRVRHRISQHLICPVSLRTVTDRAEGSEAPLFAAEKEQEPTVRVTNGSACKTISANLLCQAGIYASALYGTEGRNIARPHTCPYDSADTWNTPSTLLCVCVCVLAPVARDAND